MVAIAYAEAGAIDDARRELAKALRAQPGRPDLQRLLDSLKSK
jgi:hypothetical protein